MTGSKTLENVASAGHAPPGLEGELTPSIIAAAAGEVKAEISKGLEEKIDDMRNQGIPTGELIQTICDFVVRDIEDKVNEKVKALWTRGEKAIVQLQQKHVEKTTALTDDVSKCRERQQSLETENESLKKALASLASKLSMLGTVLGCAAAANDPAYDVPSPFSPELPTDASTPIYRAKLPAVPTFPFDSPSVATPTNASDGVATIQLAEVLGAESPQRKPLLLAESLSSPALIPPEAASSPSEGGLTTISFMLRKADGTELGLNVSHLESDSVLRVEGVQPGGAVEAWNRQCHSANGSRERAVVAGDKIISVNGVADDPVKMLEECKNKQLLRFTIVRECADTVEVAASPTNATVLRADASEFVPTWSVRATEDAPAKDEN